MSNAASIAKELAIPPGGLPSQVEQIEHRLNLIAVWRKGGADFTARTLDVGCGQGDQTAALAGLQEGEVVGVDPGPPDYGAPFTLAQAQAHLLASPLGARVTFAHGDAPAFLAGTSLKFATAVLSHSLWYFPNQAAILDTLVALRKAGVRHLALAEWSLSISDLGALPHLLSVLTQSLDVGPDSDANVRCPVSPAVLRRLAEQAGWRLSHEELIPSPRVADGKWEAAAGRAVRGEAPDMQTHADALAAACAQTKDIASMDVWAAVFV